MSHSAQCRSEEKRRVAPGHPVHDHPSLPVAQRRLEVFHEPAPVRRLENDPVLHHLEPAVLACVDPCIALLREQVEDLRLGEVVRHGDREGDERPARGTAAGSPRPG
jgi:hypothetical protein